MGDEEFGRQLRGWPGLFGDGESGGYEIVQDRE